MNPTLMTYILFLVPLGIVAFDVRTYLVNKKNGSATSIKPLQTIVATIVMLLALFAILTGQTYEDVMRMFR